MTSQPDPDDGALCCAAGAPPPAPPPAPPSRPPIPCALAKPVPAISASRSHRNHKTISHGISPHVFALPAPTTKGDLRCSAGFAVPPGLFCECAMNGLAARGWVECTHRPVFADIGVTRLMGFVALDRLPLLRLACRDQHVALPQRATPIFSFRPSRPTAPITTCLPIT